MFPRRNGSVVANIESIAVYTSDTLRTFTADEQDR